MNNITLMQFILTVAIAVAIPTLTALVGILVSNGRFNDVSARFDDLSARFSEQASATHKRIDDLAASMLQHRSEIHGDIQMLISWERERMGGGRG